MRPLFERRAILRQIMRPPIPAQLGDPKSGAQTRARILDLSSKGAGVEIPKDAEPRFVDSTVVQVSFQLEGSTPLAFLSTIRSRKLQSGGVLYGLSFDLQATPHGARHSQMLQEALGS